MRPAALSPTHLHALLIFREVAHHGSFAAAARATGVPKPTISRRIQMLEEQLNLRLFHRTTRALSLTDAGASLLDRCADIADRVDAILDLAEDSHSDTSGTVRVTTTLSLGQHLMQHSVPDFLAAYPSVDVHMDVRNTRVDLVKEGFDLAIRVGHLGDEGHIARKLGSSPVTFYAAPSYAARHGTPKDPDALASHPVGLVAGTRGPHVLHLRRRSEDVRQIAVTPKLSVNDPGLLCAAILSGQVIGLLPDLVARPFLTQGKLCKILPDWGGPAQSYLALFPTARALPKRVRAFVDHLSASFA